MEVTREDKLATIMECCLTHRTCSKCPLSDEPLNGYSCGSNDTPDYLLDKRYNIVKASQEPTIDNVNHPQHYNNGSMECIDEMILVFGKEATINFCLLNAWKYRSRALYKNGQEDMDKSDWYINKYKELKESLEHEQTNL